MMFVIRSAGLGLAATLTFLAALFGEMEPWSEKAVFALWALTVLAFAAHILMSPVSLTISHRVVVKKSGILIIGQIEEKD